MSNLITIKVIEDKTGEVVKEFNGMSERKAKGLQRIANADESRRIYCSLG